MKIFEKEILSELLRNHNPDFECFLETVEKEEVRYSGAGYYLTLQIPNLPSEHIFLTKPCISGSLGILLVGFLGIIESRELTLECYTYGDELLSVHRDQTFVRDLSD